MPVHPQTLASPLPEVDLPAIPLPIAPGVFDAQIDDVTRIAPASARSAAVNVVVLEISDGQQISLSDVAMVGRKPTATVDAPGATLVTLTDPGRSISKDHVLFGVDADGVWIVDQDSTNGTIVTLSDGQQIICAGQQRVRLPEGAIVSVGDISIRARHSTEGRQR